VGLEDRLSKLEQSFPGEPGPPPQEYYEAKARRRRCFQAMVAATDGELSKEERTFIRDYRDSGLLAEDSRIIDRYRPPRSEEETAEVRKKMKEPVDAMAARRRERGW